MITKQEEIREELWHIVFGEGGDDDIDDTVEKILDYLHSEGCVLKVEGELPVYTSRGEPNNLCRLGFRMAIRDMLKAGYVKTVPIKEEAE